MKRFNVTGLCVPHKHYMVDISGKIQQIKTLIDMECYFTINRARQYGKTTTLSRLRRALTEEYVCVSISFEGFDENHFESSGAFCKIFMKHINAAKNAPVPEAYKNAWMDDTVTDFDLLSDHITKMCEGQKIVLMIDEVDKTSNNRVFLHFLSMLRKKYLAREDGDDHTFHSVILAGVYDTRPSWNIAEDFEVNMSFDAAEIATMLEDYEADHNTGMDIAAMSEEIHNYTDGYPFLVSRLCRHIDEKLGKDWTAEGVQNAVRIMLNEKNTLFDDVTKNIENNEELYKLLQEMLFSNSFAAASTRTPEIEIGLRYGILKIKNNLVCVSNAIFETFVARQVFQKI